MYDYRKWTDEQKRAVLAERHQRGFPIHSPPHIEAPGLFRILTGTCFEHQSFLPALERLQWFERELLEQLRAASLDCAAWVVLPNHYHVLARVHNMRAASRALGQLHGRTSRIINQEDGVKDRQVWFRSQDRCMRSERHYYVTLNYIHNNPVKHGHAGKWTDWPFSSVHWYLEAKGRDWLTELWREYPVLNYGDKWDL